MCWSHFSVPFLLQATSAQWLDSIQHWTGKYTEKVYTFWSWLLVPFRVVAHTHTWAGHGIVSTWVLASMRVCVDVCVCVCVPLCSTQVGKRQPDPVRFHLLNLNWCYTSPTIANTHTQRKTDAREILRDIGKHTICRSQVGIKFVIGLYVECPMSVSFQTKTFIDI